MILRKKHSCAPRDSHPRPPPAIDRRSSIRIPTEMPDFRVAGFAQAVSTRTTSPPAERHRVRRPGICGDGSGCRRQPAARPAAAECLLQPAAGGHSAAVGQAARPAARRAQTTPSRSGGLSELLHRGRVWRTTVTVMPVSPQRIIGRCTAPPATRACPPQARGHCNVCERRAAGLECSFFITPVTVG